MRYGTEIKASNFGGQKVKVQGRGGITYAGNRAEAYSILGVSRCRFSSLITRMWREIYGRRLSRSWRCEAYCHTVLRQRGLDSRNCYYIELLG